MKPVENENFIVYYHVLKGSCLGYVGVTQRTMEERWAEHVYNAKLGKGKNGSLQGAIRTYGEESFDHYVLQENVPASEIEKAERAWILEKATLSPFGFNLCEGGKGAIGYKFTDEEKAARSAFHKEYQNRPEVKAAISAFHKEYQNRPEVKAAISAKSKESNGRPEVKAAISAKLKEYTSHPEVKEAISASSKRRWEDPEFRAAMSTKLKDSNARPEVKEAISASSKRRWEDPEFRAAMSVKRKEAWKDPERRATMSAQLKKLWEDPGHRELVSAKLKETLRDPERRETMSIRFRELWLNPEHRSMVCIKNKVSGPRKGTLKGVSWSKRDRVWISTLKVDNRFVLRSQFQSEDEAALAYDAAVRIHLGKGAFLNFPTDQERADWLELKASLESKWKTK
jgi:group I intron endonuclease